MQQDTWPSAAAATGASRSGAVGRYLRRQGRAALRREVGERQALRVLARQPQRQWQVHLGRCRGVPPWELRAWLRARGGTGAWAGAAAQYHSSGTQRSVSCAPETRSHHLFDCCVSIDARACWLAHPGVHGTASQVAGDTDALLDLVFNAAPTTWRAGVRLVHHAEQARARAAADLPQGLCMPWGARRRRGRWT